MTHTLQIKNQNKKSNKIAFFVIDDAILSLTLKGKSVSIKKDHGSGCTIYFISVSL